jgi:hypothetical protein
MPVIDISHGCSSVCFAATFSPQVAGRREAKAYPSASQLSSFGKPNRWLSVLLCQTTSQSPSKWQGEGRQKLIRLLRSFRRSESQIVGFPFGFAKPLLNLPASGREKEGKWELVIRGRRCL